MVLGEDLWDLRRFQSRIQAAGLRVAESYVSVTEVSEYAAGMPEKMLQRPALPGPAARGHAGVLLLPHVQAPRRDEHNWYALRLRRARGAHAPARRAGPEFKGRVLQVVTGSTGLDDWEWGVTLFGVHVDDLKECVYTMRFDEASTLYGEFGDFYTGLVGTLDEVLDATLA